MYEPTTSTRRGFLAAAGGTATAGLAGCLGGSGGGLDELTVVHMPIYPDLQWYVMEGEGYFSEIDADGAVTPHSGQSNSPASVASDSRVVPMSLGTTNTDISMCSLKLSPRVRIVALRP